jgi:hypothetical protein
MPDSPAAMMVNGKILCVVEHVATNSSEWYAPLSFYEYNYVSNNFTQVGAPGGGTNFNDVCWPTLLLDLPDGTILFGHRQKDFYVYQPDGVPLASGKPVINSISVNADGSLHLTGKLFNGLCQGAAYGDDEQMDSNFPLVRFTDASGNVRYGRTYNWSNTGVMKTNLVVSTECTVPAGASLADTIQVVVNGIASAGIVFATAVTNTADSGAGSLRNAIINSINGAAITFAAGLSGQTILLTSGELLLSNSVTIDASALTNGIRINGNGTNRVFEVPVGVTVALKGLTITNGGAGAGFGGGVLNDGTVTLLQCTLVGNSAYQGGAMENSGACVMTNCTLALNVSTANGAAVDDNVGSLTLTHCTIAGNTGGGNGGGIANYLRTLTLLNSIVAGNSGNGDIYNFAGSTIINSGSNLVQVLINAAGSTNLGTTPIASAPQLAPLGNYGGPTPTMPPLPGSPAFDAAVTTSLAIDQRGYPRPVGPAPDLGAVEYEASSVVTTNADGGAGSLRYALIYTTNGATISFSTNLSGRVLVLTNGVLSLNNTSPLTALRCPTGFCSTATTARQFSMCRAA